MFPFLCREETSHLLALLSDRNAQGNTVAQLMAHPVYKAWVRCDEFNGRFLSEANTLMCPLHLATASEILWPLTMGMENIYMLDDPLLVDTDARLLEAPEACDRLINLFTSAMKESAFHLMTSRAYFRNYYQLPIRFKRPPTIPLLTSSINPTMPSTPLPTPPSTNAQLAAIAQSFHDHPPYYDDDEDDDDWMMSEDDDDDILMGSSDIVEDGYGSGVNQEAFTLFAQALEKVNLFDPQPLASTSLPATLKEPIDPRYVYLRREC